MKEVNIGDVVEVNVEKIKILREKSVHPFFEVSFLFHCSLTDVCAV